MTVGQKNTYVEVTKGKPRVICKLQIMANSMHRSVLLDHEMVIEGVSKKSSTLH
jgi:hypothetical protein